MYRLKAHPAEPPRLAALYGPALAIAPAAAAAASTATATAATAATTLSTIATVTSIVGGVVGAAGTLLGGMQQSKAAAAQANMQEMQAEQLAQNAGQERAAAQQHAISLRRQSRLAASRNQAVAAASGGLATDPTVLEIQSDIAGEGEYNALTALHAGESRARGMQADAAAARYESRALRQAGKSAKIGSFIGAGASLLSSTGQTLLYKYG
jgi:hypothetical protein